MLAHAIDANGFMLDPVMVADDTQDGDKWTDGNTVIVTRCPDGFYKPQWDGMAWIDANAPTGPELLQRAQQAKLAELDAACQQTIYAGFDCDPDGSGTKYHFPYQALDQRRYDGYMVDVLAGDATDQAWKVHDSTGKWVALTITAANFKANVRTVATSFEKAQVNQFRSFESQVNAVTTSTANPVETVNAITWSPATSY